VQEYENKSLEELRVEDYLANRKGPGQGGGLMTGAFGQNTASTGLFGSTATNTGGLFGQKPAETKPLFGSTNTGQLILQLILLLRIYCNSLYRSYFIMCHFFKFVKLLG
jgi:hypothetical protein